MHVRVNAAASADGKLSTRRREQVALSGPADFERVDRLRREHDAVMVGVGTVLADDPHLTLDEEDRRVERLRNGRPGNPARVVVDSTGRTPTDARILDDAAATLYRYVEALSDDGTLLALAPADRNTAIQLRQVEREVADGEAREREGEARERADEERLRDRPVAGGRGVAPGVLTGEGDGAAAEAEADSQRNLGVEVGQTDGGERGRGEEAGDEDVGSPHQRRERLLDGDGPGEGERPPPEDEQSVADPVHARPRTGRGTITVSVRQGPTVGCACNCHCSTD